MTVSHDRANLRADTQKPSPRPRRKFDPRGPQNRPEKSDLDDGARVIPLRAQQAAQPENDHAPSTKTTVNVVPDVAPDVYTGRAADHLRDLAQDLRESDINTPDQTLAELMETIWVPRAQARNSAIIQTGLAALGIIQVMGLYSGIRLIRAIFATKATTAIAIALALLVLTGFGIYNAAN